MILINILVGLILFWVISGLLTGIIAVGSRNVFLNQSASSGDLGIILACGLLGTYITVLCIMASFGR